MVRETHEITPPLDLVLHVGDLAYAGVGGPVEGVCVLRRERERVCVCVCVCV